jgi:hypothetical protein
MPRSITPVINNATSGLSKINTFKEILLEEADDLELFSNTYLGKNIQVPQISGKAIIFTGVRKYPMSS